MQFEDLLRRAKDGDADAIIGIVEMYKPLLVKNSVIDGGFDEDLYQELIQVLLICIRSFQF